MNQNQNLQPKLYKLTSASLIIWCIAIGWSTALASIMMVISTVLASILIFSKKDSFSVRSFLTIPTITLFTIIWMSTFWSDDVLNSILYIKRYVPLILLPFVISFWYKKEDNLLTQGITYLSYSLALAYGITILWNIIPQEIAVQLSERFSAVALPFPINNKNAFGWYVPFMERIHFSNILAYTGLALIYVYFIQKNISTLILSILFLSAPFILGARASMIGVLILVPVIVYFFTKNYSQKYRLHIWSISALLLSVTLYIAYPQIKSRYHQTTYELESIKNDSYLEKDYKHFPTLIRFHSWKTAFDLVKEKPIIGHGSGIYIYRYREEYSKSSLDLPLDYHSQWLYFLGTFGVIGILFFGISMIYYWQNIHASIGQYYLLSFTLYTSVIWIFDTGLLQKKELMAFTLFLTFAKWLDKNDISYT